MSDPKLKGPQYDDKCDTCQKANLDKAVPVIHDNGKGSHNTFYYCLDFLKILVAKSSSSVYNVYISTNQVF
jgi:hypothetical protein